MRNIRLIIAIALAFGGAMSLAAFEAEAGEPGYGYGGYFGNYGFGGYGLGYGLPYATGRIPTPPYFSIHPPVYYSQPVPRTYGYSPFAYPGTVPTPEVSVAPAASVTIENPYVEQTNAVDSKKDGEPTPASDDDFANAEPQPQTIVNPYVDHPSQFPPAFDMEVTALDD